MSTTTALQQLPVPTSGDAPDVPANLLSLANAIEKKLFQVYNNATDRDTRVTSPVEGMFCILKDTDVVYRYTGSAWTQFPAATPAITSGTSVPSNGSGSDGDIYFKV